MKAAAEEDLDARVRRARLALALVALSQGVAFFHAGDEILRSKSLDRDSYNSGSFLLLLLCNGTIKHHNMQHAGHETALGKSACSARAGDWFKPPELQLRQQHLLPVAAAGGKERGGRRPLLCHGD
jgi:pullulanase/glycogen debranching enzyme